MLLQCVGQLVYSPEDRLVKQAFTHAQQPKTTWFQSLIANGTFSLPSAMTTLRDKWFNQVCQLDLTKVKCFMLFDSDQMAENFCQPDLLRPCLL